LAETCTGLAPGVTNLPIGNIERTVAPAGEQAAALERLKSALSSANEIIQAACPSEAPLTPVKRLGAVEGRLNAMLQAVQVVGSPLGTFFDTLTEVQRQRLDAMGTSAQLNARAKGALGNGLAALCSERAEGFSKVPVQRIEQRIRPTQQQQPAFDALKAASSQAADKLQSSCPTQTPHNLVDRLQAVQKRLAAMILAVKTVRPALDDFYALLDDEQKARFNTTGQS
jgi:hypothetical protein